VRLHFNPFVWFGLIALEEEAAVRCGGWINLILPIGVGAVVPGDIEFAVAAGPFPTADAAGVMSSDATGPGGVAERVTTGKVAAALAVA